jgi:hypothetical protein
MHRAAFPGGAYLHYSKAKRKYCDLNTRLLNLDAKLSNLKSEPFCFCSYDIRRPLSSTRAADKPAVPMAPRQVGFASACRMINHTLRHTKDRQHICVGLRTPKDAR